MALDINGILDALVSHALGLGFFSSVNEHESKQSPPDELSCSIWVERISPIKSSGLNSTSIRIQFEVRLFSGTMTEPYDDIDPNLTLALDALMRAYIGDFTLGGLLRHVDIFGAHGPALDARTGFINQDGKEFRVFSINLPVIVDDLWAEAP